MKKLILVTLLIISSIVVNAQWQQTNGPYGGEIYCFARSGTYIYMGTENGVYISYNNGANWKIFSLTWHPRVISLTVSGNNIFAGTSGGVYLSSDNGLTWSEINNGLSRQYVLSLVTNSTKIFAGTIDKGVYVSSDNGNNWSKVNNGFPVYTTVSSLEVNGSNLFAGTNHGLFLSTNDGSSWTSLTNNLNNLNIYSLAISGNNIYVSSDSGNVFITNNNGSNWSNIGNNLPKIDINSIAIKGTDIFAVTIDSGIFISHNNGISWFNANKELTSYHNHSITIIDSSIFVGTIVGGVFLSTNNGNSWTKTGIPITDVTSLVINGSDIFAGTYGSGVFKSANNGNSWLQINNGLTNINVRSLAISGNNIYAGTDGGGMFLSTNNGNSWIEINNGLTSYNKYIQSLAVNGSAIYAGTYGSLFISSNNGNSWSQIYNGPFINVRSIAISCSNIFVGTEYQGVFLTSDTGKSWTGVSAGLIDSTVSSLAISGTNIYAGTSNWGGVYLSNNNGNSWTLLNNGLATMSANSISIIGSNIFVGTQFNGVFVSSNNGGSWTAVNTGFTKYPIWSMYAISSIATDKTNIFLGTTDGGVWRRPLQEMVCLAEVCEGNILQISTDSIQGASYFWSGPNGFISSYRNPVVTTNATSAMSGMYYVTVIKDSIIINKDSGLVKVNAYPIPPIASNNSPVCEGNVLTLFASKIADASYEWSGPNGFSVYEQNPTISYESQIGISGIYYVKANVKGCKSKPDSTIVIVNSNPPKPTITKTGNLLESTSAVNYQWYYNLNQITGATTKIFSMQLSGTYQVLITDSNGCSAISDEYYFQTNSINEWNKYRLIKIFPNPTNGKFTIETLQKPTDKIDIEIYSLLGELLYSDYNLKRQTSVDIDLSDLQKGIYFARIQNGKQVLTEKILIQ